MNVRRAATIAVGVAALAVGGCQPGQRGKSEQGSIQRGDAPAYGQVAAAYNARVEPLKRLSAYVVLRLKYRDDQGKDQEEQVEGHLDMVLPRNVALRLDKAGQTIAMLGSNDTQYWWIELGEHKRALVGEHAKATAERLAAAGVPVHPLDLVELLGATSVPKEDEPGAHLVAWSKDGRSLIVTVPGRFGTRRVTMNPEDHWPRRIELIDEKGRVAASSDLSKYESVAISGAGPEAVHPWIATDIRIVAESGSTTGHLELSRQEIDPSRPKAAAFDLQKLLEVKEVQEVRSLDPAGG